MEKTGYAVVAVVAAAVAAAAAAAMVEAAVVAIGNEVEVVFEVVAGNNAAPDGDDVEQEHYHAAAEVEAEVEVELAEPVVAVGNEVAAVASVQHTHPIHFQTQGQHCH